MKKYARFPCIFSCLREDNKRTLMNPLRPNVQKIYKRHPILFWGCVLIECITVMVSFSLASTNLLGTWLLLQFIAIPTMLTFINLGICFIKPKKDDKQSTDDTTDPSLNQVMSKNYTLHFEVWSVLIGCALTLLYLFLFVRFVDWDVQISINEVHSLIHLQSIPTSLFFIGIFAVGYITLRLSHAKTVPPLVTVLAIAALYIGIFECILWIIQVYSESILLTILPINLIIISIRLIFDKALEFKRPEYDQQPIKAGLVGWINYKLSNGLIPVWGLVFAFPLLGIAIVILVLFGQSPDAIISRYTQTADWTLSQQIAPAGYDDHYLCTVAAQGHEKLVKPQRIGVRHGRHIIVNRQLSIANAFEQILEERTPKLHKRVRLFYDTHGFPLSKLITTKYAADVTYLIMKPLEWFFLIILYLVTQNPEERISRQYCG